MKRLGNIFQYLPLQKGIPKLSMSFHIKVLLLSETLPSLKLLYTDYSNKTSKAAMIFDVKVHHCFTKTQNFLCSLCNQTNVHFLLSLNLAVTNDKIPFPEMMQLTAF